MRRSGGSTRHPASLANLHPAWSPGQSGNPRGRRPGHKSPARLSELLASDETQAQAERVLWTAFARGERWAWDILLHPPAMPTLLYPDGRELEPFFLELPDAPGWRVLAERLCALARENPSHPPAALLRAAGAQLAELYGRE